MLKVYEVTFAEDVTGIYITLRVAAYSKVDALTQVVNTRHVYTVKRVKRVKDAKRRK